MPTRKAVRFVVHIARPFMSLRSIRGSCRRSADRTQSASETVAPSETTTVAGDHGPQVCAWVIAKSVNPSPDDRSTAPRQSTPPREVALDSQRYLQAHHATRAKTGSCSQKSQV